MIERRTKLSLFVRVLATILYNKLHSAIRRKCATFSDLYFLRIKVMEVQFQYGGGVALFGTKKHLKLSAHLLCNTPGRNLGSSRLAPKIYPSAWRRQLFWFHALLKWRLRMSYVGLSPYAWHCLEMSLLKSWRICSNPKRISTIKSCNPLAYST